jgi:hypothetical protein
MRSVVCSSFAEAAGVPPGEILYKHNDTSECQSLLNISSWTVDDFVKHYAGLDILSMLLTATGTSNSSTLPSDPPSLLQLHMHMMADQPLPSDMPESSSILQSINEEDSLWNGPNAPGWVACNQRNKTCYGKIAKSAWYNPATRSSVCTQAFNEQARLGNVKSVAEGLDTCNLNNKLDELCEALQSARTMVMEANCIFAGVCAPQVFVYTPGTYSSSNQDFVRGMVTSFYEMFRQVAARWRNCG